MPKIFIQSTLHDAELGQLQLEFPLYDLITDPRVDLSGVEILYGDQLSESEFKEMPRLHWIHCPEASLDRLCMHALHERGNILVTLSKGQNVGQIAEFVMGAILSFAKQFFHWPQVPHEPEEFWNWPLKETMWTLKGKVLLQVGLGEVGTSVVRHANAWEMKTWGMQEEISFHAECHKTFGTNHLHSLLPHTDVVVLALPKGPMEKPLFTDEEFELMKGDSILIVIGSAAAIDENGLASVAKSGKFRGILLDTFQHPPPAKNSPLFSIPNAILTPSVASYPQSEERVAFRLFRRNLRLYVPGRITEMKNLVTA